jgi:hypothetical protein
MSQGKRRVERIPKDWVDDVRRRVDAGREFREGVRHQNGALQDAFYFCLFLRLY